MASTQSTEDIAFLNSGRYLEWSTQETGTTTTNGEPASGSGGISVVDEQVVKLGVVPNSGASLSFRVWIEYEGLPKFKVVDGSERVGIDYAWTQQINVSGAARIYVEITAIDTGSFDVQIGRAVTLPNKVLRRRRVITDWSDLGAGILGESVVYEDGLGGEARMTWNPTTSRWRVDSTGGQFVTVEDWTGTDFNTSLWNVTNTDLPYTFNAGRLDVDWQQTDPATNLYVRFRSNIDLPVGGEIRMDATHGTTEDPGGGNAQIRNGIEFSSSNYSYTVLLNFSTSDEVQHAYRINGTDSGIIIDSAFDTSATHTLTHRWSEDLVTSTDQKELFAAFEQATGDYTTNTATNSFVSGSEEVEMIFYFRQTPGATFTAQYTGSMFPIQIRV